MDKLWLRINNRVVSYRIAIVLKIVSNQQKYQILQNLASKNRMLVTILGYVHLMNRSWQLKNPLLVVLKANRKTISKQIYTMPRGKQVILVWFSIEVSTWALCKTRITPLVKISLKACLDRSQRLRKTSKRRSRRCNKIQWWILNKVLLFLMYRSNSYLMVVHKVMPMNCYIGQIPFDHLSIQIKIGTQKIGKTQIISHSARRLKAQ